MARIETSKNTLKSSEDGAEDQENDTLETFEFEAEVASIDFVKNCAIAIGVNQYQYLQTLEYAVRDAEMMKHWFDEQNFSSLEPSQIDLSSDPTSATVKEFLQRKFEEPFLSEKDNLWFFFSGHSRFQDGVDYLMLADSIEERVTETGVSLNFLVKQLLRSGAGKVILFLDMDRLTAPGYSSLSSSFVAEGKNDDQGVIIFYACEPNTAAYEANQLEQGSFTYTLQKALFATQGNLSINQLAKFLSDRFSELNELNTQPPQTPQSLIFPSSLGDWVPLPLNFQVFDCQTRKVNGQGETIQKDTKLIRYFTEPLTDNITLEMVAIPGGTFTMGSPENEGSDDERPQHNVTLSPFFMGKYPITQAQWKVIATRTDLKVNIDLKEEPSHFKGDNRPVEQVNWYEAVEFCQRLSKLTGRDYQLPSEAQWEYACRAMTEPLDLEKGETYPPFYFGETITGELANYDASGTYADEPKGEYREETTPVGQFPPNTFGLYDMHGNVDEWCADDWQDNYNGAPNDGRAWLDNDESDNLIDENMENLTKNNDNKLYTVIRGGSWLFNPIRCRSAYRINFDRRDDLNYNNGFRVVCVFGRTQ
ncbi:SUMF1/EgtB/PvdO family nonheme iron enzyme [Crocosphaera sp. Alani8]|uniref:SUMF1/EgtB/PvdO family nonheme iron enzyme n=1 Tax=Crocosphaera sp. Alani8 TaxID=3038952 RepID=UPI00313CF4A6